MEQRRADWVFAAEPRSVPTSRALIADTLSGLSKQSMDVVLLLATELVTNAVRHGAGPVAVTLAWEDGIVRVEVADHSVELPAVQPIDISSESGRGLILVDGLSSGWGVVTGAVGKAVWFTVNA